MESEVQIAPVATTRVSVCLNVNFAGFLIQEKLFLTKMIFRTVESTKKARTRQRILINNICTARFSHFFLALNLGVHYSCIKYLPPNIPARTNFLSFYSKLCPVGVQREGVAKQKFYLMFLPAVLAHVFHSGR